MKLLIISEMNKTTIKRKNMNKKNYQVTEDSGTSDQIALPNTEKKSGLIH